MMLAFVDLKERVPNDHPFRIIKTVADEALDRHSREFDRMYSKVSRVSAFVRRTVLSFLPLSICCELTVLVC